MSDELLSMDEIKARYTDEWVLIDDFESDPVTLEVLRGKVVYHSKERDEAYRRLGELPSPKRIAVYFTGLLRKDMVFVL